ncbi:riboflavin synthase [Candidatus Caldipriscus sp.]|nr:riboflavin synthase [Candidatus Caldipriscus sp.]
MFSGIIEGRCRVREIKEGKRGLRVLFEFENLREFYVGQSISIDGVCLTVEDFRDNLAEFFLSDETLRVTKFGRVLVEGYVCNFERALKVGDRIDGHFVLGHVDGIGEITEILDFGDEGWEIRVKIPKELLKFAPRKGSIALDGTSLTINSVEGDEIRIRLIPQTLRITAFPYRRVGDLLNVEVDVLARYVHNLLKFP